jgi:pimeloyl-ACP methyl ester carboxylesterase
VTATSQPEIASERWLNLDGVRVRYLEAGSGHPLVLIHGLLGYSFSWRFTIPAFAPKFRVIAPDLPGAGFSQSKRNLDYQLRDIAKRLLEFLDALGIGNCDLLGSSHGGAVAMMAASLAPERVKKLVLVSPVNPWSAIGRRRARFLSSELVAPLFNRWAPRFKFTHPWVLRRLYGDAARITPGTLEGYSAPYAQPGSFTHNLKILETWSHDLEDLKTSLPRISQIPTLLIWGTLDRAVNPASAYQLKQQFQDSRLVMFEGVGHLPYEESPDDFNRTVGDFLDARS